MSAAEHKVHFLTTERDHIADVAARLMKALPAERLQDPANPVLVSVRGSYSGGKKIVPDAARHVMFARAAAFAGSPGAHEVHHGLTAAGDTLEIDFINSALWPVQYDNARWVGKDVDFILDDFLKRRLKGGVTFVHNNPDFGNDHAHLEVWIEDNTDFIVGNGSRLETAPQKMRTLFNRLAGSNDEPRYDDVEWARYVQVRVADAGLRAHPAIKSLLAAWQPTNQGVPLMGRNVAHVPVNLPQCVPRAPKVAL